MQEGAFLPVEAFLNHLEEPKNIQVFVPMRNGASMRLQAVAQSAGDQQHFLITFRDDATPSLSAINLDVNFLATMNTGGPVFSVQAKFVRFLENAILLKPKDLQKHAEKREYFRVPATLQVWYWPIDDAAAQTAERRYAESVDISGNGILLRHWEPLSGHRKVGVEIRITEPTPCTVEGVARVVRHGSGHRNLYETALTFTEIEPQDQECIIAYCFSVQRRLLREKVRVAESE
jgi:hypothetical protein